MSRQRQANVQRTGYAATQKALLSPGNNCYLSRMTAAAHYAGMNRRGTTGTPLNSVTDASPAAGKAFGFQPGTGTFGYDANGNLRTDPYKGITTPITYNYLNLPQTINYGGGKSLTMVYDATGTKLRTTAAGPLPADNYIHDYAGGIEYRKGLLEAIYHEEGRVTPKSGGGWQYEYSIRDHLGNTRLTFADLNGDSKIDVTNTSTNEVLQENHYYPFGLAQHYSWMNAAGAEDVRYKFNGIERVEELGWEMAPFRSYDGALGRWMQVDPKAEAFTWASPYNSMLNNPITNVDPLGDTTRVYDTQGVLVNVINDSHVNEDHFIEDGTSDFVAYLASAIGIDADDANSMGSLYRASSSYFIGTQTRRQMGEVVNTAESENKERAFALVLGEGSKQLQAVDIGDRNRSANSFDMPAAYSLKQSFPGIVMTGHVHPMKGADNLSISRDNVYRIHQPSSLLGGYGVDYDKTLHSKGFDRSQPLLIGSVHGYSIYSSTRMNPKTLATEIPNGVGQVINWLGHRIPR
ncbi:RHS repeat-associated core domain-containing protein [Neolewinella lacunae]|uniref:RHS repeat-associated core domain-containing protein n=1 Tax=Neolewinella lacunae TaxID=1517758 RepID=A0A923PMA0_9BACT|nr:RHS repeat-associated core domain-containing protein [Neolewinella lacunae]MBC6993783.1 hypothetical protein [Neolewinella lacunae]MDN3635326.1 RHS repeat-associated core domain-containing protein [Neolewinella lacunae]